MKKYKHTTTINPYPTIDSVAEMGKEGWKLVSVVSTGSVYVFFWEKEIDC